MITNHMMRKAVKALIEQYKDEIHEGGFKSCPLCQLYNASWDTPFEKTCVNCPNYAFQEISAYSIPPCSMRTRAFPALDWGEGYNPEDEESIKEEHPLLIKFWEQVLTVLPTGHETEFILTEELSKIIVKLATQIQAEHEQEKNTASSIHS